MTQSRRIRSICLRSFFTEATDGRQVVSFRPPRPSGKYMFTSPVRSMP